jgi:hypothetical protein
MRFGTMSTTVKTVQTEHVMNRYKRDISEVRWQQNYIHVYIFIFSLFIFLLINILNFFFYDRYISDFLVKMDFNTFLLFSYINVKFNNFMTLLMIFVVNIFN